jgi:hypothetical protein
MAVIVTLMTEYQDIRFRIFTIISLEMHMDLAVCALKLRKIKLQELQMLILMSYLHYIGNIFNQFNKVI